MSLPEMLPTDLPQFVRLTPRSAFANSVVPQGCALFFAESDGNGGSIFLIKKPDGTFEEIGGKMKFYKCASVSSGKWQGKLAIVDPVTGVWDFSEETVTRPYGNRITPVVGGVYDADCTFMVKNYKIGVPENGLIFYLSMAGGLSDTDDTGTFLLDKVYADGFTFTTRQGIPCGEGGAAGVRGPNLISVIPNAAASRYTIAAWIAAVNNEDAGTCFGFSCANPTESPDQNWRPMAAGLEVHYGNAIVGYDNYLPERVYNMQNKTMAFYHITFDGIAVRFYKNKVLIHQITTSLPFGSNVSAIYPVLLQRYNGNTWGAFSAFRIYTRVLDELEIDALANEFTPTPAE